jgi:tripartite ATP-independent transporter DctM subunit
MIAALFIITILIGLPVAFCLCFTSIVTMFWQDISLLAFVQNLSLGINSFPLLAVPFFILSGQLMNTGGMTHRIFNFANYIVGPIRGGLGQVNIAASLVFAGMSGAAVADAAGLGVVEINAMKDAGYDSDFSVAITAASSTIGPIIPPSIIMVIYGIAAEVSIGRLFVGGILPGILMTLALAILTYVIATRRHYPVEAKVSAMTALKGFIIALPALFSPLIIVGGILGGVFTPTEAGAVAVLYSLVLGLFVYKELKLKDLPKIFIEAMLTTSLLLFIVGAAKTFGWVLTYFRIPAEFAEFVSTLTSDPLLIIFLFIGVYLFLGCFMEAAATVIMTVPVVLPLIKAVGIDPVFFGVVVSMCMSIGTLTPPLGIVMYIMCEIGDISVERYTRVILPYLIVLIAVIILMAVFPNVVLYLPNLLMG